MVAFDKVVRNPAQRIEQVCLSISICVALRVQQAVSASCLGAAWQIMESMKTCSQGGLLFALLRWDWAVTVGMR